MNAQLTNFWESDISAFFQNDVDQWNDKWNTGKKEDDAVQRHYHIPILPA